MRWLDLLWLLPVMVAVAVVLGTAGRSGREVIMRSIWSTFVALTLGVVAVGVAIHLVARIFA